METTLEHLKFPCAACIVKRCCNELCDKLTRNHKFVEVLILNDLTCPDCSSVVYPIPKKSVYDYDSFRCIECNKFFKTSEQTFGWWRSNYLQTQFIYK